VPASSAICTTEAHPAVAAPTRKHPALAPRKPGPPGPGARPKHRRRRAFLSGLLALTVGLAVAPEGSVADDKPYKTLNPYQGNGDAVKEGRALYLKNGCSGCHGVQGGGGMAVPLLDDAWKFGGDDETLVKLIKGDIPDQTMPRVFKDVLSDDEVWKILAYIRSLYKGDPTKVVW